MALNPRISPVDHTETHPPGEGTPAVSERRRQPDYDFFVNTAPAFATRTAPEPQEEPAQPPSAPDGVVPTPPGAFGAQGTAPGVNRFGIPLDAAEPPAPGEVPGGAHASGFAPPPAYGFAPPPAPGYAAPAAPGIPPQRIGPPPHLGGVPVPPGTALPPRTDSQNLVIGLVLGAVALVVIALVGAGVALSRHGGASASQWRQTTVALPTTWRGAQVSAMDGRSPFGASVLGMGKPAMGAYQLPPGGSASTDGMPATAVVMASVFGSPMSETNQRAFRTGFERSWRMMGLELEDTDPGQLGGSMGCGAGNQGATRVTVCLATDSGAYFLAVFSGSVGDVPEAARELREATVHRGR